MEQKRLYIFSERFNQLRGERTQGEFADFLGISRPTVGFYENGTRVPDAITLRQIAEKCEVSSDWLLGLSDYNYTETQEQTAESLGLPEEFVHALLALRQISFNDEYKVLQELFRNTRFFNCLKATCRLAHYVPPEQRWPDGIEGSELVGLQFKKNEELRAQSNGQLCVCDIRQAVDGEITFIQNNFYLAVVQSYDKFFKVDE